MTNFLKKMMALRTDRKGVTALEYGLIASLIAVAIISGVTLLGTNLKTEFSSIATTIAGEKTS